MAVKCRDCDSGRASKLNAFLSVDNHGVVYSVVLCDECFSQHEIDGMPKLYRVSVRANPKM